MNNDYKLELSLPSWSKSFLQSAPKSYPTLELRVKLAIELSRLNVENNTGGPFGAAVFDVQKHSLISLGVNLVIPENCSTAHAEIMAISLAQKTLSNFDLSGDGVAYELVCSAQPCVMCFGAIIWSGIKKLTFAACAEDVEEIVGFDEGPLVVDWQKQLEKRGVVVEGEILREQAVSVLKVYKESGKTVYNSKREFMD